jgi:hypothetical protein
MKNDVMAALRYVSRTTKWLQIQKKTVLLKVWFLMFEVLKAGRQAGSTLLDTVISTVPVLMSVMQF